jgi:hypothetical protein
VDMNLGRFVAKQQNCHFSFRLGIRDLWRYGFPKGLFWFFQRNYLTYRNG